MTIAINRVKPSRGSAWNRCLWFVMLAACGGGSETGMDAPVDSAIDAATDRLDAMIDAPPDAPVLNGPCNPLTQTGCSAGAKCTWIVDEDSPPIGHVGCAPEAASPVSIGGACVPPPAGPQGYDTCVEGAACIAGECKQICDVMGGAPTCPLNQVCTRYAGIFEVGGNAVAGVCDPTCDPLTQEIATGDVTAACGSTVPETPNLGCYGYGEFSCAPVAASALALTDRAPPLTNRAGNPFLNGCAPGFLPFFYEMTGSTVTLCTGLCAALEIDNTSAHVGNNKGNAAALAKLPLEAAPLAGNGTCDIGKKGGHASSSCRFFYPYVEDDQGMLPLAFQNGPHLDTLGVCFAYALFNYDADQNINTPNVPYPDCATLPPRSAATPGDDDDAADWGCQKRSSSMFTSTGKRTAGALRQLRLAVPDARLPMRHTFH